MVLAFSCERELDDLQPAEYPSNPNVFIDGFSGGLEYAAFGGSVPTAFDVDNEVTYLNTSETSMRFEVPDAGDPRGAYAGGAFFTTVGRDLTEYDALTFWAKASKAANIDVVGFGNDLGEARHQASVSGLAITTNWQKYIIPLPDPSRLTAEKGLFFYSEGPEDDRGYTFWVDELKFEKLGTLAHPKHSILNGEDQVETSFVGVSKRIEGLSSTFNLPTGVNRTVGVTPAYFEFASSDESIAVVDGSGVVTVVGGPGTAEITATVGGVAAEGSLTIESVGDFVNAPTPVIPQANVISLFSEAYMNEPVDYYNGYWEPFQTTLSADFEVNGDRVLNYTDFNFVGIQFTSPTIDATAMTHLHVDIYLPNPLAGTARMQLEVVDFGSGGTGVFATDIPASQAQQWISLDVPLSNFAGLGSRAELAQVIFVDVNGNIPGFYADNIFFYDDSTPPTMPATAAPTPTHPSADVLSIFSDAYTAVEGTDFFPDWGQATVVSEVAIEGNNTLKYTGLNYQGIQLAEAQDVSDMAFLHIDYWTDNSAQLNVFLISPGPVETPVSLAVPTSGWGSVDIPLSDFSPVALDNLIQLKFDGNGDIFLDNIYFRK